MRLLKALAAIALASSATACASVTSGTSQTLRLDTVPAGADCSLTRKGLFVGRVNPTPGTVSVQRARDDITVSCTRDGYQTGTFINKAGFEAATLGNVILGGVVGVAIDAASGANNKYDADMRITLAPSAPGQGQEQVAATAAAVSAPAAPRPPERALDPAEFRCPSAGTVVRTSAGQQYKFTQANGIKCGYTDENGAARERYAVFADGLAKSARSDLDTLWPLRIGKRIEFDVIDISAGQDPYSSNVTSRSYRESFEIVRQQSVTVPAGTFDTFVVEWREQQMGTGGGEALITLWYAPRTGYLVKSSVQIISDNALDPFFNAKYSGMNYEATTVMLPGEG